MTKIVGIINITPDSFSDKGKNYCPVKAMESINQMIEQGVDVIDIGAQSTRPGAIIISAEEEWKRLEPILEQLNNFKTTFEISLDSFYPQVIKKSLDYGIGIINDVGGFESKEMVELAVSSDLKIIFMHSLTIPANKNIVIPETEDEIKIIKDWLRAKIKFLENKSIKRSNMIFDPGIGFGKTSKQSLNIISNINHFQELEVDIMVGHSEKSFLNLFTSNPSGSRGSETKIFSYFLAKNSVDYIRVHDVEGNKKAVNLI